MKFDLFVIFKYVLCNINTEGPEDNNFPIFNKLYLGRPIKSIDTCFFKDCTLPCPSLLHQSYYVIAEQL